MTSSMRNSLHRRNHKERSQLASRSKFGLLEKHADYVKRARDYHAKQDRLQRLRQKAADRNKDEFYFAMTKQKTKGGVHHHDRGNVALPMDMVKVLKTQDENYIRTVRSAGLKKIERLKTQLMVLSNLMKSSGDEDDGLDEKEIETLEQAGVISRSLKRRRSSKSKASHVVFVDSLDEAQSRSKNNQKPAAPASQVEPPATPSASDLGWKVPKIKGKQKAAPSPPSKTLPPASDETEDISDTSLAPTKSNRTNLLKELSARLTRDTQLRYAMRELEMQRLMTGKGSRKKIERVEKGEGEVDREEEDEDEIDANKGRRRTVRRIVDEKLYRPRVYKWKMERK